MGQKIGAGHAKAWARAGLKEISQVLHAFPTHGVQPVEEPGLAGNLTPMEVAQDKGAYESVLEGYTSQGRAPQQERSNEMER